jgi:ubiquinone/menaquinone biosynthesis C-methylase UbiE
MKFWIPSELVRERAEKLGPWYHEIPLTPDYTTRSVMTFEQPAWSKIRQVRDQIPWAGSIVLDVGTMDGMWAFEAEQRGASHVLALDIWSNKRFLFAREVLQSHVLPVTYRDIQQVYEAIQIPLRRIHAARVDVIQCFSILHHIQNPFLALHQMRRCLSDTGILLLEAVVPNFMAQAGELVARLALLDREAKVLDTAYWLPTADCLMAMLDIAGFEPIAESVLYEGDYIILAARAKPIRHRVDDFGSY